MPNCIIIRGLPGSGKSTLSELFRHNSCVVSADSYFYEKGEYKFDAKKLWSAHSECFQTFIECCGRGHNVVVDNTNTTKKEYQRYVDYAKEHGYKVIILTVETDLTDDELAKRNIHGVPVETIKRMRHRMKSDV